MVFLGFKFEVYLLAYVSKVVVVSYFAVVLVISDGMPVLRSALGITWLLMLLIVFGTVEV